MRTCEISSWIRARNNLIQLIFHLRIEIEIVYLLKQFLIFVLSWLLLPSQVENRCAFGSSLNDVRMSQILGYICESLVYNCLMQMQF